jgi:hypothetical protein
MYKSSPALSVAVQPYQQNHDSGQDGHSDADCGKASGPEGRPDSSEKVPVGSAASSANRTYIHQRDCRR